MPELRAAGEGDLPALSSVFLAAEEGLARRLGRPAPARSPSGLEELLGHLLRTDPHSTIVAVAEGRVIAFGVVHVRAGHGFLAFLYVLPEWQGRGLGRTVAEACRARAGAPGRMATCAAADQPVPTALYASLGMVPRTPVYLLRGALRADAFPEKSDVSMRPLEPGSAESLDDHVLGYSRPVDHAFWRDTERRGWQLEDRSGALLAYGYVQASGRVGPVAASAAKWLPVILGRLARDVPVADGWQVLVPGPAASALGLLLGAGLRIDGSPAVYCSDHPTPAFERYLPMSFALL